MNKSPESGMGSNQYSADAGDDVRMQNICIEKTEFLG